ncbi:DNA (cytosine-5)-methyltransferase cmt3 [Dionaea muscipula]
MTSKRKASTGNGSDSTKKKQKTSASAASTKGSALKEDSVTDLQTESPRSSEVNDFPLRKSTRDSGADELDCRFLGEPVPMEEAKKRWPHRYISKEDERRKSRSRNEKGSDDDDELMQAKCHYLSAVVDGTIYTLGDDAHVQAEEEKPHYICNIIELFEGVDGLPYFRAQWFYRSTDTKIKNAIKLTESKRIFLSEIKDDNPLDCLAEKLKIARVTPTVDNTAKRESIAECNYYCDMLYLLPYSTFICLPSENDTAGSECVSTVSSEAESEAAMNDSKPVTNEGTEVHESEMTLLDLYSGCGAMSTGLCLGANLYGVNLVTRWAVDTNNFACQSLKLNHPETEVRNETVEDFLELLKEWEKLCQSYSLIGEAKSHTNLSQSKLIEEDEEIQDEDTQISDNDSEVFEVERILGIRYGDPKKEKRGVYLKVRWRGYGEEEDSWEPIDGLGDCQDSIKEFVTNGFKAKILPLPGNVSVICGGPPCQGVSGFNRFRNKENPLDDVKNKQLKVFMDVVNYLRPNYVLMENVVDLLKFAKGFLGSYALGRLVDMNYQARVGIMAAGSFGLPQFRLRTFIWGALPSKKLPPFPLPTHDLVLRGNVPVEFEICTVAYDEGSTVKLEKKLLLGDAISDLPSVNNDESRDEMPYGNAPEGDFQRFIRLKKDDDSDLLNTLYDHRPLPLNEDDYQRVCCIPKKKGACFRDLPGVIVGPDNKVALDPNVERVYLPSKKPLVPNYAITFVAGTSSKPFGRLWYDETVPTVVTRAEPHNQVILHPSQDRVLTIRENARLQGFPDYYQLKGPVKERYIQVGNAVAVPVARALGYALAMASQGASGDGPLVTLPPKFPSVQGCASSPFVEDNI